MLVLLPMLSAFFSVALAHVARQIQTTTITVLPSSAFPTGGPLPPETPETIIDNGVTYSVEIVTGEPSIPVEPTIEPSGSLSGSSTIVLTNPSGPGPSVPPSPTAIPSGPSVPAPNPSGSGSGVNPPPSPSPSGNSAVRTGFAPLALLAVGLVALY